MAAPTNILVIKLGAFGDFVQALGPMAAIREHHPDARITLLTTAPFITLARESGYFDDIWTDTRPSIRKLKALLALRKRLHDGKFSRVYDLQNNDRTSLYLWLTGISNRTRPEWVGAAFGASHRNASPERISGHAFEGHVQTLGLAGLRNVTIDQLDWVRADASHFGLPHPYILLIPGSAPNRPEKRWPAAHYGALARHLFGWGYTPVVVGTLQEDEAGKIVRQACPDAINLCGQTSMMDLVALARNAAGAIGNDTGPMHLIAPTGCPTIVLFSRHSDPVRHGPKGTHVRIVQKDNLSDLSPEEMLQKISTRDFRHKGIVSEE